MQEQSVSAHTAIGRDTFLDVFRNHVETRPDQLAFRFIADPGGGWSSEDLTFGTLDLRARAIAAELQARGLAGRRVLLLYPSSLRFVEAFLGCLFAGATAVPAPLPIGQAHHVDRLVGILRDASPDIVLTVGEALEGVADLVAKVGRPDLDCRATDAIGETNCEAWIAPQSAPGDIAFIQYTSGTTSTPQGVMVSQANLVHNERMIQARFGAHAGQRGGGWLPLYHDMGLIGQTLCPLFCGGSGTLIPPVAFLMRPHCWLEMIGRFEIEYSGGPDFCYDLCLRRVTDAQLAELDLSCWHLAFNGAEPVRATTMRAFAERFASSGFKFEAFYPCYGLAESTLIVSGGNRAAAPLTITVDAVELGKGRLTPPSPAEPAVELVGCGASAPLDVRIVDPESRRELPAGEIGEIWIAGDSVAAGYWQDPRSSAEVFDCETRDGAGGLLRSGDLGAIVDGELFVTGRRKEMIIVNGRNIYPADVEREVQEAHPLLGGRPGAAFGVETATGEQLVVVQAVKPDELREREDEVAQAVRDALGRRLGIGLGGLVLVPSRALLRTTSGKIQRLGMRDLFLAGEPAALHLDLTPTVSEQWARS